MTNNNDGINRGFWTEEEEALLYSMRQEGIPYSTISVQLKKDSNACRGKYDRTNWASKPYFNNVENRLHNNIKRSIETKLNESRAKAIDMSHMKNEIFLDKLSEIVKALPNVKRELYIKNRGPQRQKHSPEDVGLVISDCHIGQDYTKEETGGLFEYNVDIFRQRCQFLQRATADIVELHSKLYPLPNLHIMLLGDIVAGMNETGDWNPTYISMSIMDQVLEGLESISSMIYYWLTLFDKIYVYGVAGNHARAAKKGVEKEYVNWDFATYKYLQERFGQNERVVFKVPKTWWIMETIKNHKFLMVHGEDVKGGGGSNLKPLQSYLERMQGIIKNIPDYIIAGHFHSPAELTTSNGRIIVNGSWTGGDVYSLKNIQKASRPEQKIFGIHDKRGVTWTYNLNLEFAR